VAVAAGAVAVAVAGRPRWRDGRGGGQLDEQLGGGCWPAWA